MGEKHSIVIHVAIITGSYDLFAAGIAKKLKVHHWYANTVLEWDSDNQLVDFHYIRDQAGQKLKHLKEFADKMQISIQDCVVIGDGDNDIEIFKATGQGISVASDNTALNKVAWRQVQTLTEIIAIIQAI